MKDGECKLKDSKDNVTIANSEEEEETKMKEEIEEDNGKERKVPTDSFFSSVSEISWQKHIVTDRVLMGIVIYCKRMKGS